MSVVLETTIGDITVDLYLKERPNACLNFLKLCKTKYYNLCVFHKVERNFIAQTGDPTATGRGGESIFSRLYGDQAKYFEAELKPRLKHEKRGTLSMVNNSNNMNGSQFFLTLGENLTYLDEVHTVFGEVTEGFDTLLKLNEAICDPNNRPFQDIRITHTVVLHDPYDDPSGLEIPDRSPEPTKEMLETDYIAADEDIDDTKGRSVEEIEEKIKESEAKARATILEMVGDIPDADVKPPENVLFVCKLNPVTTSEDLELIFSRFGVITSCEVIKDKKSGESLQYAFIEFEKEEDCENAYFKMDNVLIDDRRIHVDFSQSVSKLNFDKDNRFLKGKSGRDRNFVIKGNEQKSDGYEMIFDMDDNAKPSRNEQKDKHKSNSSYKKAHSKDSEYRNKKRSTVSPDERLPYSHTKQHPSKDTFKYSKKSYQDYSRSPSPVKSSFKKSSKRSSRSPTRHSTTATRHTRHDSRSNSSPSPDVRKTSYKDKHYSPDRYKKEMKNRYETNYPTNKKRNGSPSRSNYSESRGSVSSSHQMSKHSSRNRSRSPNTSYQKKRSENRRSPSVSPKRFSSKYDKMAKPKHSSRKRSPSTSPPRYKFDKKSTSKNSSSKTSKVHKNHKKDKSSSSSTDSSDDSDQVNQSRSKSPSRSKYDKKSTSKNSSFKSSKAYKKHQKPESSSGSSDSSDDSEENTNRLQKKSHESKYTSSHKVSSSHHKHSHKAKRYKRSSS